MTTSTALRLVEDEMRDTVDFLRSLSDEEWDAPSLCDGWRVRDVVGHMASGVDLTLPGLLLGTVKAGMKPERFSFQLAVDYANARTPAELIEGYEHQADELVEEYGTGKRHGIARVIDVRDLMVDHLIHHEDMRRPLGKERTIDEERLQFSLEALPQIGGMMHCKQRVKGLKLHATDLDVTVGDGPELDGPAADVILAASGRTAGLDHLEGDGAATLRARLHA
jgi:uncharacterized protein (TIGR03083 family)